MSGSRDHLRLPDELMAQLEPLEAQLGQKEPVALVYGQGYDEGYAGKVRWPLKSERATWRPKALSVAYGLGVDAGANDPRRQDGEA